MKYLLGFLFLIFAHTSFAQVVNVNALVTDKATTGAGTAAILGGVNRTYFAYGSTTSGSGSCAMKVQVSNDNVTFLDLATITLTLSSSVAADGLATIAPWKYARGNVSAISGTGAKCSLMVGSVVGK